MQKILILIISLGLLASGCEKSKDTAIRTMSSYTMVNATIDVASARTYAADHEIVWRVIPRSDNVAQYRFAHFGAWSGNNIIRAVNNADTTKSLFSSSKAENFEQGKLNTIFLCGNAVTGYGGIFLKNEPPGSYADSVVGIRFINLSPNSTPLSITLSGSPNTIEVAGISYQQKSDYKTYPALASTPPMIFEIRDASGTLLASYTLKHSTTSPYTTVSIPHTRFKNLTLVIKGLQGTTSGTNALGIMPVAHY